MPRLLGLLIRLIARLILTVLTAARRTFTSLAFAGLLCAATFARLTFAALPLLLTPRLTLSLSLAGLWFG